MGLYTIFLVRTALTCLDVYGSDRSVLTQLALALTMQFERYNNAVNYDNRN